MISRRATLLCGCAVTLPATFRRNAIVALAFSSPPAPLLPPLPQPPLPSLPAVPPTLTPSWRPPAPPDLPRSPLAASAPKDTEQGSGRDTRVSDRRRCARSFCLLLAKFDASAIALEPDFSSVLACPRMCSLAIECVLLLYNVFSNYIWPLPPSRCSRQRCINHVNDR